MPSTELDHLKSSFEASVNRRFLLWSIRWTLGFAVIAAATSYYPSAAWLWYFGGAISVLSLLVLLATRTFMARKLGNAESVLDLLQNELAGRKEEIAVMKTDRAEVRTSTQASEMGQAVVKKLERLRASSDDLSKNANAIILKWSKRLGNPACLAEQEMTPYRIAFLYLLLEKYDDLVKAGAASFLNENVRKELPDWEPIEQFDANTDVGIHSIDLDNLENNEWEIAYSNKYDLSIFHVRFKAWQPSLVGFTF